MSRTAKARFAPGQHVRITGPTWHGHEGIVSASWPEWAAVRIRLHGVTHERTFAEDELEEAS